MKHITHLISASDYILEHEHFLEEGATRNADRAIQSIFNYAKFLKTPLTLSMFVPTDNEGNVLKEPKKPHTYASENTDHYIKQYNSELEVYDNAKENVLFEGFEFNRRLNDYKGNPYYRFNYNSKLINITFDTTVEQLIMLNLKLTPAALKMIYNY